MVNKRIFDFLKEQAQNHPLQQAFGHKKDGEWQYYSTREMVELANRTSVGLLQLGLQPGDKVATVVYQTNPE